jgi:hypothetical protein
MSLDARAEKLRHGFARDGGQRYWRNKRRRSALQAKGRGKIRLTPLDKDGNSTGQSFSMGEVDYEIIPDYPEDGDFTTSQIWVDGSNFSGIKFDLPSGLAAPETDAGPPPEEPTRDGSQAGRRTLDASNTHSGVGRFGGKRGWPSDRQHWPNRTAPMTMGVARSLTMSFEFGKLSLYTIRLLVGTWAWTNWYCAERDDQMRWADDGGPCND